MLPVAGAIVATSNLVPLVRLAVLGTVVAPSILPALLPLLATGLVLGLAALMFRLKTSLPKEAVEVPELENPTHLNVALGFGALYALILFASAWLSERAGSQGLYAIAAASGFVDVDAISLSSLNLLNTRSVTAQVAASAIGIAYIAAVVFKLVVLGTMGGRGLLAFCAPSLAGSIVGTMLGLGYLAMQ
jgi:uncharacterized membrane protein (DUF4010 family)